MKRRLSEFALRLFEEWKARGWPTGDARIVAAVSGGADSVSLLLALSELVRARRVNLKLFAAHMDHGLRGERSADDARFVVRFAASLGVESVVERADVGARARVSKDNLEQAARRARYEFLSRVAREREAVAVLTAHTLDDQAETVLLRLLRGSGAEGLTGIRPERVLSEGEETMLLRPLVAWARRADTVALCRAHGAEFRTDEMNEDESFARVRVRRKLLPLLETFNPRAVAALARTADLLAEDSSALEQEAARLLKDAEVKEAGASESVTNSSAGRSEAASKNCEAKPLRANLLAAAPSALRRRALRRWIEAGRGDLRRIEMAHLLGVEKLLFGERGGRVAELPGGGFVERRGGLLRFHLKRREKARAQKQLKKA